MHISRVELENFKSHVDSAFEFGLGPTAITGRNGAGKTSIIEAIAWAF
ncbi:MAG: AAA family ATPase [Chloracidobacterium sp.]|nr:AAA family ATPase [Chloracidobacterium sp.]